MTRAGIETGMLLAYLRDLAMFKYCADALRFHRMTSGRRKDEGDAISLGSAAQWRAHALRIILTEDIPSSVAAQCMELLLQLDELEDPRMMFVAQTPRLVTRESRHAG